MQMAQEPDPAEPQDDCPDGIFVSGAESVHPIDMGEFARAYVTKAPENADRPVYKSAQGEHPYLFYWSPSGDWKISPSFHNSDATVESNGDGAAECPQEASDWQVLEKGAWTDTYTVLVKEYEKTPAPSAPPTQVPTESAWTEHTNRQCLETRIQDEKFSTTSQAEARCKELPSCWGVYVNGCEESPDNVFLCDAERITSAEDLGQSEESCVLRRP